MGESHVTHPRHLCITNQYFHIICIKKLKRKQTISLTMWNLLNFSIDFEINIQMCSKVDVCLRIKVLEKNYK